MPVSKTHLQFQCPLPASTFHHPQKVILALDSANVFPSNVSLKQTMDSATRSCHTKKKQQPRFFSWTPGTREDKFTFAKCLEEKLTAAGLGGADQLTKKHPVAKMAGGSGVDVEEGRIEANAHKLRMPTFLTAIGLDLLDVNFLGTQGGFH